uniref:Uncharacterized protein n=1 Tax=Arion vulgaris TaxID=1028688 RepID=A0A0B7BK79_9EUPU
MGPRIITATFRTNKKKTNLKNIQCFTPTNDRKQAGKERFYTKVQCIMERKKKKEITI